MQQSHFGHYWQ